MGPSDHMTRKPRALPGCRHIRATLTLDLKTDKELDMGRRGQMWATFRSGDGFQMIGSRETRLPTDLWQQPVGEVTNRCLPEPLEWGMAVYTLDIAKISGRPRLHSPTQGTEGMKPCFLNLWFCSDFWGYCQKKNVPGNLLKCKFSVLQQKGGELGHVVSLTLWTVCCTVLGPPHIA